MIFRKAAEKDLNNIMRIINNAKDFLKENKVDQWQNGYPNKETILLDIENGYSYVLEKDGDVLGTVALSFDGEETYNEIYAGDWTSIGEYAVIHRIAVDISSEIKNLGTEIIKECEKICLERGIKSIKIDTHEDNLTMQKLLEKNKFRYCGIIYLKDKAKRIAFEKQILN